MRKPPTTPRKPPYGVVFGSPDGRLVLLDILRDAGIMSTAFDPSVPGQTEVNLGKQLLGLGILQKLRWTESDLLALSQERITPDQAEDLQEPSEDDDT